MSGGKTHDELGNVLYMAVLNTTKMFQVIIYRYYKSSIKKDKKKQHKHVTNFHAQFGKNECKYVLLFLWLQCDIIRAGWHDPLCLLCFFS